MSALEFPEVFRFLFDPKRYKVAHGGRGSGKSWAFARALLIQTAQQPLRVLCTREIQKSIKESVHRLLSDQIQAMGLGQFFEVVENEIRGANGSLFVFAGLASHTVESIKSYEGVDRVWIEEAQTVSKKSWDILTPTIRKDGSEIWVSLNPDLDTDETYQRFVVSPPADSHVVRVNWDANPWFPAVLEAERLECQRTRPRDYANIWEGACKIVLDGAIYAEEILAAVETGRICNVPADPMLKTHCIFDLGWNDAMTVILVQRMASEIRVIDYMEHSFKTLEWFSSELRNKRLLGDIQHNWGTVWLPHDGRHKNLQTGKSAQEVMQALKWSVQIVDMIDVETGIRNARQALPRTMFDRDKAARLVECLKRYRRAIPTTTGEPAKPVHDEYSHGADAYRYLAAVADKLRNEEWGGSLSYPRMNNA